MIPLIDFQQRSLNGPVMKAEDFDLSFSMKVRELVDKFSIKYNPDQIIIDDTTADAVFNAGVELLADIGLYHLGTQRVVKYTKDEILKFAGEQKENPAKFTLGRGNDEFIMEYRTGKDTRPPVMYSGAAGVITEDEFVPLMKAFVRERKIKGLGISGGIEKVGNIVPKAGTLSEIYCGLWEQEKLRQVLEEEGRPGMCLGLLCTVSTVGATMQCISNEFRGPHNTHIGVHIMPEQKIDWDRLLLAHFCHDRGIVPWQSSMSMIGGLCRDAADAAVSMIANLLGQMSYAHGPMCSLFPTHIDGTWATRPCIWSVSAALRASEQNIRIAIGTGTVGNYLWGSMLPGILQEAAMALIYTASGFSYTWLAGSPMESVLVDEILNIAAGMNYEKIIDLAGAILEKVDELCKTVAPRDRIHTISDIYDIKTIQPLYDYEKEFNLAKEELVKLGLPLG